MLAIDFGTTRTKVAYCVPGMAQPELVRFGPLHRPFLPSLVYVHPNGGPLLFGDDAEAMLADDPAGVIDVPKRRLRHRVIRANGRSFTPDEIMRALFGFLHGYVVGEVAALAGQVPEALTLTVPALFGPAEEEMLRSAAAAAGFPATAIRVVSEPEAAAQAWLAAPGNQAEAVIVLDCGGGTTDWAWLKHEGGRFRLAPQVRSGGLEDTGSHDVDLELHAWLAEALGGDVATLELLRARRVDVLTQLARLKESAGRRGGSFEVKLGTRRITVAEGVVRATIQQRFVARVASAFAPYLAAVQEAAGGATPPVLLAGGAARTSGLQPAIEDLGCRAVSWESAEVAVAIGALGSRAAPASLAEVVVDADGNGDTADLAEASRLVVTGGTIRVRPGVYTAALALDRPVSILGDGERERVVVEGNGATPAILWQAAVGRLAGLTICQRDGARPALAVHAGQPVLENCDLISTGDACLGICGKAADPVVRGNKIRDGKSTGVLVYENGRGTLEGNEICGNAGNGVEITTGGAPVVRGNKIRDNKGSGVVVRDNGQGTVEGNEISSNTGASVRVESGCSPTVRNNAVSETFTGWVNSLFS